MLFGQDRNQLRRYFFQVWEKYQKQAILEPLEIIISDVIKAHPEYHELFSDPERELDKDYTPEMGQTNPFLHMAMHIGLREQVQANQPEGIATIYAQLLSRFRDTHKFEHDMIECLGQALWEAQNQNRAPDDQAYLECLRKI